MIEVCCAIIVKESKILAVQRGPESRHPWKWEFPGGKINGDETAEECIVREIEEELILEIEVVKPLLAIEFAYGKAKSFCLIPFVCHILAGKINLTEHIAQRWLSLEELETMDWQDADRKLILKNQEELQLLLKGNI
jgi:8-oxo-dGTP diphosphatase